MESGLTEFHIPKEVYILGRQAFCRCKELTFVELNENLTEIPEQCFIGTSLSSVTIPEQIKVIGDSAF